MTDVAKVAKLGVSNLKIAKLDEAGLVDGEVLSLPGTTEVKLDITAETVVLYADNGPYVSLSGGISETKLTVNNYDITPEAKKVLFNIDSSTDGIEHYGESFAPNDVAVYFETMDTDNKKICVGLMKGKFNLPGLAVKTKGDGAPDPDTDEIEGSFVMKQNGEKKDILVMGRESNAKFVEKTFTDMVFPKTAPAKASVVK